MSCAAKRIAAATGRLADFISSRDPPSKRRRCSRRHRGPLARSLVQAWPAWKVSAAKLGSKTILQNAANNSAQIKTHGARKACAWKRRSRGSSGPSYCAAASSRQPTATTTTTTTTSNKIQINHLSSPLLPPLLALNCATYDLHENFSPATLAQLGRPIVTVKKGNLDERARESERERAQLPFVGPIEHANRKSAARNRRSAQAAKLWTLLKFARSNTKL